MIRVATMRLRKPFSYYFCFWNSFFLKSNLKNSFSRLSTILLHTSRSVFLKKKATSSEARAVYSALTLHFATSLYRFPSYTTKAQLITRLLGHQRLFQVLCFDTTHDILWSVWLDVDVIIKATSTLYTYRSCILLHRTSSRISYLYSMNFVMFVLSWFINYILTTQLRCKFLLFYTMECSVKRLNVLKFPKNWRLADATV